MDRSMERAEKFNRIGGIITVSAGATYAAVGFIVSRLMPVNIGILTGVLGLLGVLIGYVLIKSVEKHKESGAWAKAAFVLSILGLVSGQGFVIGPVLGLVGSAMMVDSRRVLKSF